MDGNIESLDLSIDIKRDHFPCCLVWTPVPIITCLCPIIGHMGIALSNGVIRDFDMSYNVRENNMAYGRPVRYQQLNPNKVDGGAEAWDRAVTRASVEYEAKIHNICSDNCHCHVARALNLMNYGNKTSWNMCKLALSMFFCGKYVSFFGVFKSWCPFVLLLCGIILVILIV